jgi:NRAMP (natural resistance-associated macrophage protein)-like metal ion transporter
MSGAKVPYARGISDDGAAAFPGANPSDRLKSGGACERTGSVLRAFGPGLITGASDDDPSGIATYSQAGAQFGFAISWTLLLTYPLMAVVQEISARIGRTTGHGVAANIARHYPNWISQTIVGLLVFANVVNIGADLGAMGDAVQLLIGGPRILYVLLFGCLCAFLQVFMAYARYVSVLKWLTLTLFAYFGTALFVKMPWAEAVKGLFLPTLSPDPSFWTTVVAILGTTISPYLFFWQAAQEVEDIRAVPQRKPLRRAPAQGASAEARIAIDTYVGMAFSNLVALAIVMTTAATLHVHGITDIETSRQAAEALRPVAGEFAFALFALGIIGTGLLAVPVLAASASYALAESRRWPSGLSRRPFEAKAFYGALVAATFAGIGINFSAIDPVKALFWSAVVNGVVAVPVMIMMMLITSSPKIMGRFTIAGNRRIVGWVATGVMASAAAVMLLAPLVRAI